MEFPPEKLHPQARVAMDVSQPEHEVPVLNLTQPVERIRFAAATLLRVGGIHPPDLAFAKTIGPAITQFAEQWA